MNNLEQMIQPSSDDMQLLFHDIAVIIKQARQHVRQAVNLAMVQSYWQIGRQIVEREQQGQQRAAYGKQQLQLLSKQLTSELAKALIRETFVICVPFICVFQFGTQCVPN